MFNIDFTGISYALISKKGKIVPQESCLAGFKNLKIYNETNELLYHFSSEELQEILRNKQKKIIKNSHKFVFERRAVIFKDIVKGELKKTIRLYKRFCYC